MRCLFGILLCLNLLTVTAQSRVGILLYDGVQIIDYTGPYEVFANAELSEQFRELSRMYRWETLDHQRVERTEYSSYLARDMYQRTWKLEALLKEVYPQKFSLDLSVSRD